MKVGEARVSGSKKNTACHSMEVDEGQKEEARLGAEVRYQIIVQREAKCQRYTVQ